MSWRSWSLLRDQNKWIRDIKVVKRDIKREGSWKQIHRIKKIKSINQITFNRITVKSISTKSNIPPQSTIHFGFLAKSFGQQTVNDDRLAIKFHVQAVWRNEFSDFSPQARALLIFQEEKLAFPNGQRIPYGEKPGSAHLLRAKQIWEVQIFKDLKENLGGERSDAGHFEREARVSKWDSSGKSYFESGNSWSKNHDEIRCEDLWWRSGRRGSGSDDWFSYVYHKLLSQMSHSSSSSFLKKTEEESQIFQSKIELIWGKRGG